MNVVLMLAHSVEEYDQVKLLSSLGYDVFSIGAYSDPAHPSDDKRPALSAPDHPELRAACHAKRVEHIEAGHQNINGNDPVDWAKADLPDEVLDWADVIICHHFEHTWIVPQWNRIRDKRVIWRTVGQSVEHNERMMAPLHRDGLEIIRYSPKEENIPGYAGKDALIRFYADPQEWQGWQGDDPLVINVTQNLMQRDPYTNYDFWNQVTMDLPRMALGPGSEEIEGSGPLSYYEMQGWLRSARAYLYTGTQPASYTLGLIEAMMTGIPIVSIGPEFMTVFPFGPELFEGQELVCQTPMTLEETRAQLAKLLDSSAYALGQSNQIRKRAIELFGRKTIAAQWVSYLGAP